MMRLEYFETMPLEMGGEAGGDPAAHVRGGCRA